MITIRTTQKTYDIRMGPLKKVVRAMLQALDYADFDIGIWLTTNKTIRVYNKQYRNKDKPTDILSFPVHPDLKAGQRIKVTCADDKNLGDLIISLEYLVRDARTTWDRTADEHLVALLAHGIAHLLGHDHINDDDFAKMQKLENKLIKTAPKNIVLLQRVVT